MTWIFLNVGKYGFSIIFGDIFGVISQWGVVRYHIFNLFHLSSSPKSHQSDLTLWSLVYVDWIIFFRPFRLTFYGISLSHTILYFYCGLIVEISETISWQRKTAWRKHRIIWGNAVKTRVKSVQKLVGSKIIRKKGLTKISKSIQVISWI